MNAVTKQNSADIMEQVIIKGDLSKLTPQERTSYYMEVCKSIGLNPLTKPFEYILLNNKLQLYALKACTEQLRGIHGVSVTDLTESLHEGVFIVTAKVVNKDGRTDAAKGAVPIAGLKGENLANAMMKAETKAKRRATLSLCGLGWLDESEVESIAGAQVVPGGGAAPMVEIEQPKPQTKTEAIKPSPVKEAVPADAMSPKEFARHTFYAVKEQALASDSVEHLEEIWGANKAGIDNLKEVSQSNYLTLVDIMKERKAEILNPKAADE